MYADKHKTIYLNNNNNKKKKKKIKEQNDILIHLPHFPYRFE